MARFSQTLELIDKITAPLKKMQTAYQRTRRASDAVEESIKRHTSAERLATVATLNHYKNVGKTGNELRDLAKNLGITIPLLYDVGSASNNAGGGLRTMFSAFTLSNLAMKGLGLVKTGVQSLFALGSEQGKYKNLLFSMVGDESTATALFSHIKNIASESTASVGQLTNAYQTFMSTTKNVSNLDKLANVAERLAMFDTTGQGFDGAVFSVKELASGDYTSIAERFNISRSKIQEMGIHNLFKAGDIEGGIAQFELLLDQMGYTREAAMKMSTDPTIMWNRFTSNLKTKWADAMELVMSKISPFIARLEEITNSTAFDNAIRIAINAVINLVNMLIWLFETAINIYNFFVTNWSWIGNIVMGIAGAIGILGGALLITKALMVGYTVVMGVAVFVGELWRLATGKAVIAQTSLNGSILACPIFWLVALILAVVAALIYWSDAAGTVMGIMFVLGAFIGNILISIYNYVAMVAEFFVNVWKDPVYAVKKLFYDLWSFIIDVFISPFMGAIGSVADLLGQAFVSGANIAIKAVNGIIGVLNKIPGVEIGEMGLINNPGKTGLGTDGWNLAQSWKGNAPTTDADVWNAPKIDYLDYNNAYDKGFGIGKNGAEGIKDFIGGVIGIGGQNDPALLAGLAGNVAELPETLPGATGNPAKTEEIDISDESIKLMRDVANMRFVQNFVTVTPDVKFGDVTVHETADYKDFATGITEQLEEELTATVSKVV